MPYSFDDIDVIDLERALDEGRMTPFVDNKSYKISLKSIDDDVLNNIRGSLVTPLPIDRPVSRTESVVLFKNILNGNEQVTVDFVSSDLNDFIGNFPMDDLLSRPGSRVPSVRTPPLHHHNKRDSLLLNK
ncbi:hypothetical protein K501DRAFT_45296 [Backusella circina FSU 941]|nr:hypothetical protein K501DRAFT_45296 [Backusella circina FSU 941]